VRLDLNAARPDHPRQRYRGLDEEHGQVAAADRFAYIRSEKVTASATVRNRGVLVRASALRLAKSIAKRAWAGYVGMPLLIALGLAVLILLNLAHRSLWGQLLYAVAITTAVVWGLGQLLCKHLEIPLISVQRSFLWAAFGVMALPLAVAHGLTALMLLFGVPLLWLAAYVGRATIRFPRKTPPPWTGLVGGVLALTLFVVLTPRAASGESPPRASPLVTEEDQQQAGLARQVRPLLLFDENEARFPVDIRAAVDSRLIETCRAALGGEPCKFVEQESELDLGADYLNVADVRGPRGGGTNSAYYYRVVPRANRVYVDYWWYFTRNPTPVGEGVFCAPGFGLPGLTCHEHASDWEGVTVVLGSCKTFGSPCVAVGGKQWSPVAVRYAQHEFIVSYVASYALEAVAHSRGPSGSPSARLRREQQPRLVPGGLSAQLQTASDTRRRARLRKRPRRPCAVGAERRLLHVPEAPAAYT
jgi:hypothetical protein